MRGNERQKEHEDHYHKEMMKFLRGEPSDITPGTIGMQKSEIAKKLVESDPTLLLEENKERFYAEIAAIFKRDHAISVKLSTQDLAAATMMVVHEDDLPRG